MNASHLLLILLPPLFGFIINGLFYKKTHHQISSFIACLAIAISFAQSLLVLKFVNANANNAILQYDYFKFLSLQQLNINFSLTIDKLNIIYVLIITFIGLLIHIYSIAYMHSDKAIGKYFAYLNLFIFSMLLLVLGSNYLILFIGWEGVGLCSFLLIGFWNNNKTFTYAARKAFIMNRIGDLCFLIAIFILLYNFKTLDFKTIQDQGIHGLSNKTINAIAILLFLGATGKSAQIPLYTWLPDAMAGPTPVSALIHAATMVTAGIFLISRAHFVFDASQAVQQIILYTGVCTAFLAATIACMQSDIKKVLAYSTVSQLGFMFISIGVGNYEGAIFHVITHAFFKALLFLGAGSVIHAMDGEQNIFKMGALKDTLKKTNATFFIACLAIAGIPGLSGFFSKDNILMSVYAQYPNLYWCVLFIALLTAYYIFRMYYLTFHGTFRGSLEQQNNLHESPKTMTIPLIILAAFSIGIGYINIPHIFGGHSNLATYLQNNISIQDVHLSAMQEWSLMITTIALVLATMLFTKNRFIKTTNETPQKNVLLFIQNKWLIDDLYNILFVKPIEATATFFKNLVEPKIIDKAVEALGSMVFFISTKIRLMQGGKIGIYIFWMLLGIIILFACLLT